MHELSNQPRTWIGYWLMGVALVHTAFAGLVFTDVLRKIAQRGVFDSVGDDPLMGAVTWFVLFGLCLALLALAVTALERSGQAAALRQLGFGVLMLCGVGLVLMPASGFWLAIPPALALLRRREATSTTASVTSLRKPS